MTGAASRVMAVMRLELRTQRREPLTVLYVLVLGLLAGAFAAAGPVELVRGRGAVPRDAAWSMMLASTALTAFGQVITTMVAATVVLRDRADRVADLLVATALTAREYRTGKLLAALLMLSAIYAAIPAGLVAGAVVAGGTVSHALAAAVPPFIVLVLPTMLAVGALQFGIGVLSGRLWVIVGQGLLLIWLWTSAVAAIGAAHGSQWALLADPFGSAPLLNATRGWSDAERAGAPMPVTSALIASRILWLCAGGLVSLRAILGSSSRGASMAVPQRAASGGAPLASTQVIARPLLRAHAPDDMRSTLAVARYVARWMLRDAGWRVLALLGGLNVAVHGLLDAPTGAGGGGATATVLQVLHLHTRLFLILLATIYAGELVWREREEWSAALFDALPVTDGALLAGRLLGVWGAQAVLVLALAVAAVASVWLGVRAPIAVLAVAQGVVYSVFLPFVAWFLLALAVHVLVQQKVAAHLLCIAGWVLVVLRDAGAATPPAGSQPGWSWLVACVGAVGVARLAWTRGTGSRRGRWSRIARPRDEIL